MTLETGRKCNWDEIEVGEIFALYSYMDEKYQIEYRVPKICNKGGMALECLQIDGIPCPGQLTWKPLNHHILYKLPLSVQQLWKEE